MIEKEIHLTDGNDSVGYIRKALKEINSNKNHSFSAEEVQRLRDFEKKSKQSYAKLSSTMNEFSKNLEEGMKSFQIALKKIGRQSFQNLKNISEIGWYVSPNIIQKMSLIDLRLLSKNENIELLEDKIINESENKIVDIIENAIALFPKREKIFNEILDLYNHNFYTGLINLCYSQVDGVCHETFSFSFFDKDGKPHYELKALEKFYNFDNGVNPFFVKQLSINENEITMYSKNEKFKDLASRTTTYNRHLIMHGHSFNYGCKKNALRAILLLDFICYFIELSRSE